MSSESPRIVLRYLPAQRVIHWIGVTSFLTLLTTGITLTLPPLSFLAAGGLARLVHRIAAVLFVLLPFAYAILLPRETKELLLESITFAREEFQWLLHMPGYLFGRAHGLPPQGRLNAGQKLHHASTFLMFVTVSLSGAVLWFGKGQLGGSGLAAAAMLHDLSTLGLVVLMIGHVYFTFLYDAFSAMVTGHVTEEYARMEHPRWVVTLPLETLASPGQPSSEGKAATGENDAQAG